jgi:hypothetical protein
MQGLHGFSVLLYGSDEFERIDEPKVQARKSRLGDVLLLLIVSVALMPSINIDPQSAFVYEYREAIFIDFAIVRAIVIREPLKTSASASFLGQLAIVFINPNVHPVWINDGEIQTPRWRVWIA